MFSSKTSADRLAFALAEYQKDFEKKLQAQPDPDAEAAKERIRRAKELVRQSGLGNALVTLLEHVKYWPSWSQRDDFKNRAGFPMSGVLAKKQQEDGQDKTTNTTVVCFVYDGTQYALRFKDNGSTSMPDGDTFHSGTVEFIFNKETVLGLDISEDNDEFTSAWHYSGVHALRMGPWSKALLEIAAHISAHETKSNMERNDAYAINKAKNITI